MSLRAATLAAATAFLAACSQEPLRAPPSPPAPRTTTAGVSAAPPSPELATRKTVPGRVAFSFQTHATSNLLYQLDCLAELMPCSTEAYEKLWHEHLGWTQADDAALAEWKRLRRRFRGELSPTSTTAARAPVLVFTTSELDDRQRWAGHEATSLQDYRRLISLLVYVGDAARLADVARRFEPRFDGWWQAEAGSATVAFVEASAALVADARVVRIIDQAARFYETDLPAGAEVPVHFVYRPDLGNKNTHAELIEARATVEVVAGERPEERMGVVLHELFHLFRATMSDEARTAMLRRFADHPAPEALALHALLDEALATALGNGLVDAVLEPAENAKSRARPLGLYNDAAIDAAAKSLLAARGDLDPEHWLSETTLSSAVFVDRYVAGAKGAFGKALRPIDTLRIYAGASEPEHEPARRKLRKQSRAHESSSFGSVDGEVQKMLVDHPRQSAALFVKAENIGTLGAMVPAATLARLKATARREPSFVDATPRGVGAFLYVFVAPDGAEATKLVQTFVDLQATGEGTLIPARR